MNEIFLSKFSSKFFWDLFRGFRARHTRVASTPRGIFLVIIRMRFFSQNFPQNFFSEFFPNFFFQFFFPNFFVKIFLKIFSGFASRVSRETHACCEHPTRDFSRDYMNENFSSKFSSKFFLRIFFSKFFCQNFPQNFFGICFEGFARDTRVLRGPHAGFFS